MKEMIVPAKLEELETVTGFVREQLEGYDCPMKQLIQIEIAVEELYVNIARYAYRPVGDGYAAVRCEVLKDPLRVVIQFLDDGIPYNPLEKPDPDITKDADEREIGGLGIFMVKQSMDGIDYSYENGKNILTIRKTIEES